MPFPLDVLRLEFDCSVYQTYSEVDAVKLIGTYDAPSELIGPPYALAYQPHPLSWGPDSFQFELTNCIGDNSRLSPVYTFSLAVTHVLHPPSAAWPFATVVAEQGVAVPVLLNGSSVDSPTWPTTLLWVIRTLPTQGQVLVGDGGGVSAAVNMTVPLGRPLAYEALVPEAGLPVSCGESFTDSFVVQLLADEGSAGRAYDIPRTVHVSGLVCNHCVRPYVLDSDQGTCQLCPRGQEYDGAATP
eukprot:RCo043803